MHADPSRPQAGSDAGQDASESASLLRPQVASAATVNIALVAMTTSPPASAVSEAVLLAVCRYPLHLQNCAQSISSAMLSADWISL